MGGRLDMLVQLSEARNNLSELQTINLTLRFNSISIVTSAFGRSRCGSGISLRRNRSAGSLVHFWRCAQACRLVAQD